MDDYFHPLDAIDILERAKRRSPDSYTYNIIWGLAEAQRAMTMASAKCGRSCTTSIQTINSITTCAMQCADYF